MQTCVELRARPEPAHQPAPTRPAPVRQALQQVTDLFSHVRVVRDYPVLQRIGRLRHRQYVERQGKPYTSIVLDGECLIEPADFSSVNIYAEDARGITCAMRIAEAADDRQNSYAALLSTVAHRIGVPVELALTCTRLVRAPHHSGRHAVDLIRFVRWQTVRAGWRYCLMQTAEKLVPFFAKFEFQETGVWSDDPAAGRLQVLLLDTEMRPLQGEGIAND